MAVCSRGNDLTTAGPGFGLPGLKPVTANACALPPGRAAVEADVARAVVLTVRNEETLAVILLDVPKQHALDLQ
jgi:uncharacterized protein (DUF2237 family)